MENTQVLLNIVWTMVGAFLVYFMQAGFAMVETGFTRAKNSGNILMKNMMDFVLGSIFFFFRFNKKPNKALINSRICFSLFMMGFVNYDLIVHCSLSIETVPVVSRSLLRAR